MNKSNFFGSNIRLLRRMQGLSQTKFATAIGLKRSNIASYESGLVEPNITNFLKICAFFSIDPDQAIEKDFENHPESILKRAPNKPADSRQLELMSAFVEKNTAFLKMLHGFRVFYELRSLNEAASPQALNLSFQVKNLLDIIEKVLDNNWSFIKDSNILLDEEE